jgi:hypothetical protein
VEPLQGQGQPPPQGGSQAPPAPGQPPPPAAGAPGAGAPPFDPETIPSDRDFLQQALAGLQAGGGNVLEFLRPDDEPPSDASPGPVPASAPGSLFDELTEEQRDELARELTDRRSEYISACGDFFDIEQEIRDAYAMRADSTHSGTGVEAAQMVSEQTMNLTDQVTARLNANTLGVTPFAKVEPIALGDDDSKKTEDLLDSARAMENFIHCYGQEVIGWESLVPAINLRAVKLGSAVLYIEYVEETVKTYAYTKEHSTAQANERTEGRVVWNLIPNRHVMIWPFTLRDWQREYEIVGHAMYLSPSKWREQCARLEISDELRDLALRVNAGADDEQREDNLKAQGVDIGPVRERFAADVEIVNLFCHMTLPGRKVRERFQVHLDQQNQKIVWMDYNRWHSQKHGYHLIPYKRVDEFAWAMGLGHEVVMHQAADSTFRNIQIDNLMAGCYWLVAIKPDLLHQVQHDRPTPGQVIPMDDPTSDLKTIKLGGEVPELLAAMSDNQNRARTAAGIPPVLSGMGDPVQKSGTGSGATQALIEQGGQKIGDVDREIRLGYSGAIQFTLEVLAQCAPDGVLYNYAPDKDVQLLRQLRWTPPRGEISRQFKVSAQAPNANTSYEARQRSWLLMWQYIKDTMQTLLPQALALLQDENPGAIPRLKRQVIESGLYMLARVIEDYQIPGALQHMWTLPTPLPQDETIGNYVKQIQQLQQQLQQASQQDKPKESIPIDKIPPPGMANLGQQQMLEQAGIHYPPPQPAPGVPSEGQPPMGAQGPPPGASGPPPGAGPPPQGGQ